MVKNSKELTKESIITAASMVFGKYGYKKTTLEDITSYLNIGKTAIYYYFKNKEDIFSEVIKQEATNMHKALLKEVKAGKNPLEKFVNYANARMDFLKRIGNYYAAIRYDLMEQLDFINQSRKEFDEIEIEVISGILLDGCETGFFEIDDIPETATTIAITLKSLELPFFGSNTDYDYKPILSRLIKIFLNGILKAKVK